MNKKPDDEDYRIVRVMGIQERRKEEATLNSVNQSCLLDGKTENKSRKPIRVTAVRLKHGRKTKFTLFSLLGLPSI